MHRLNELIIASVLTKGAFFLVALESIPSREEVQKNLETNYKKSIEARQNTHFDFAQMTEITKYNNDVGFVAVVDSGKIVSSKAVSNEFECFLEPWLAGQNYYEAPSKVVESIRGHYIEATTICANEDKIPVSKITCDNADYGRYEPIVSYGCQYEDLRLTQ